MSRNTTAGALTHLVALVPTETVAPLDRITRVSQDQGSSRSSLAEVVQALQVPEVLYLKVAQALRGVQAHKELKCK